MARNVNIGPGRFFIGADTTFEIPVYDACNGAQVMTGWALEFVLRDPATNAVLLTKTSAASQISLSDLTATDDQANVTVLRADTLTAVEQPYAFTLWRTNAGANTVISYGTIHATKPAGQ
jgi:hypothetical protein